MIRIQIRYYNIVADFLGRREEDRMVPARSTLHDLVRSLSEENHAFQRLAVTSEGVVSSHLRIFHNQQVVLNHDTRLADGDQIMIFPAISGG